VETVVNEEVAGDVNGVTAAVLKPRLTAVRCTFCICLLIAIGYGRGSRGGKAQREGNAQREVNTTEIIEGQGRATSQMGENK